MLEKVRIIVSAVGLKSLLVLVAVFIVDKRQESNLKWRAI